jgi:DNA-binding NarL/FixJ family response regulator
MPVRVLISDCEPLQRAGIRSSLQLDPSIVIASEVDDVRLAVAEGQRLGVDLILLSAASVVAAHGDILERQLSRTTASGCPIVLLANPADVDAIVIGVRSGVRGFVDKQHAWDELAQAVSATAAGHGFVSPTLAVLLLGWMASRLPRGPARLPLVSKLSGREQQVLTLLGRGDSNAEIARRLEIREATVRSHVYHIMTKLGLKSRTEAALLGHQWALNPVAGEN